METGGTLVTDMTIVTGGTVVISVIANLGTDAGTGDTVLKFHLYLLLTERRGFRQKKIEIEGNRQN